MASIVLGGVIATVVVIVIGIIVALPPFLQPSRGPSVLLAFNVVSDKNMPTWCREVSDTLNRNEIDSVVFFTGRVAQKYPECVASFDNNVDIGSSTYSYKNLSEIPDYLVQLQEVSAGKEAVDLAGNLESRSFRAPYGSTDENIYSILSRSNISADFSYGDRYHKYHEDQFIWFPIAVYDGSSITDEFLREELTDGNQRSIQINLDNSVPISRVREIIGLLKDNRADFRSASELTSMQLTIRGGA